MTRSRKRNPYRGSRRIDATCRCHGSCDYCRNNRLYSDRRRRDAATEAIDDHKRSDDEDTTTT